MRSDLRIHDLEKREVGETKLLNLKVPVPVMDGIDQVKRDLRCTKTEVAVALINEGLDAAEALLKGWKPKRVPQPPPKRVCSVPGCGRAHVAKGYCGTHYQAARRGRA
jgi:hypothetical protein